MTPFLTAYLARTGWQQPVSVDIATLRGLHLHHNSAVPFENIDVVLPREIQLDEQSLVDKLVTARRGGYCFEQNGLFERALREVGFHVRSLLGRVVLANPAQMPPRTHRLLLVELEGERWIADVGFGGQTLTAPIRLVAEEEQATPHGLYRLINDGCDWVLQLYYVIPAKATQAKLAQEFIELATSPEIQAEGIVKQFNWYPGIDAKYVKGALDDATWQKLFAEISPETLAENGKSFPLKPYFDAIKEGYESQVSN